MSYLRHILCKMRLIFPGINGPTVPLNRRRKKLALKILIKIRKNLITISTFRGVMHIRLQKCVC